MRLIRCASWLAVLSLLSLAACEMETEFRDRRAVPAPVAQAGSEHEIMGSPDVGVPLLTIDLPNKKEDTAHVHTILDNAQPAATRPATGAADTPAPAPPTPAPPWEGPSRHGTLDMVPTGTRPADGPAATQSAAPSIKVVALRKPDDQSTIAESKAGPVLTITSASGIGSATLAPTGETWPGNVTVLLRYAADKPFTRLEGFTAQLLPAKPGEKPLTIQPTILQINGAVDSVLVPIPAGTANVQLQLSWVDAYR